MICSWNLIASPFFLTGALLWLLNPLLCYFRGETHSCLSLAVAAAFCFLFDAIFLFLEWRKGARHRLALTAIVVYGLASIIDFGSALMDVLLFDRGLESPWWFGIWADVGFAVAGTLEAVHHYLIAEYVQFFGSCFFAAGGAVYVLSDILCEIEDSLPPAPIGFYCWVFDIIAALLFCINALVIFIPTFVPIVKAMILSFRSSEQRPLFVKTDADVESFDEENEMTVTESDREDQ